MPGRPRPVHTPGHTHGPIALHLPDRDALITGDALVTHDPYTGRRGPVLVAAAATADPWRRVARCSGSRHRRAERSCPATASRGREGVQAAVSRRAARDRLRARCRVARVNDGTHAPSSPTSPSTSAPTSSPGRSSPSPSEPGKEYLTRAVRRAAYKAGRALRRRAVVRPVGQARADRARARRHARVRPAVVRRAHPRARRAARGADRVLRAQRRPACSTTWTPCAPAATACPRSGRASRSSAAARSTGRSSRARHPAWAALVHPGPRAGRRAGEALGADRCTSAASTRTTRSRPGRRARAELADAAAPSSPSAASTRCTTRARAPT